MNICTALWSFKFYCLSQLEISTDSRTVSTFLHSNMLVSRCFFRSNLGRLLIPNFNVARSFYRAF